MKRNRRKIITLSCAFALCGILGVVNYINSQEPVILETVSDTVSNSASDSASKPPAESGASEDQTGGMVLNVKSAVLMDAETGKVLLEQNSHKELPPASVTKVMTMLLTMEAIDAGKAKLTDQVTISERAASMGGSQMYMEIGETHTLEELLEGIAVVSANDACVAIAEYIAGSEEVFVEKMNNRAKELGLRDTHFVNTNGLPVTNHYTSAYDIGVMSQRLLKFPKTRDWFLTWQKTIKVGLPGKETEFGLTNTNKLIKQYPGANGIKTGFTQEAGFCLSASATKENTTLIAVVLGAQTSKIRFEEISKLLNYGFANYSSVTLADEGQRMKKVKLEKGEPYIIQAVAAEKVTAFVRKGEEKTAELKVKIDEKIRLPLEKGAKIGRLEVYVGKEKVGTCQLISDRSVKRASFVTYYIRKIKNLF